jgi:hypothetical protein
MSWDARLAPPTPSSVVVEVWRAMISRPFAWAWPRRLAAPRWAVWIMLTNLLHGRHHDTCTRGLAPGTVGKLPDLVASCRKTEFGTWRLRGERAHSASLPIGLDGHEDVMEMPSSMMIMADRKCPLPSLHGYDRHDGRIRTMSPLRGPIGL